MKLRNLFFAALSVFALTACNDTPESPYNPGGGTGGGGSTVTGDNLLTNSSFETWAGGVPTGWGQTVTNATYSQSTEANTGESAVLIEGNDKQNKRLASKSYTLTAGKYTLAAHLKQSGDNFGQFRLGYAKLTDGVVADTENDYIYLTSAAAVTANWKQTAVEFTLEAETEVAFIVMNSKNGNGAPILVDDVILVTVDGAVIGGADDEDTALPEGTYIKEAFKANLGTFTTQQTVGNYPWVIDYSTAKMTSYDSGSKTDNAATSWLVSPAVDFTEETAAYVAFEYIIRYAESGKVAENHQLLISDNYAGDVATATWTDLPYNAVEGKDWNTFYKANVNIPAEFLGKSNVTFALRYTATTKAGTWEVRNFVVAHGTAEAPSQPEEPETPDTPTGDATVFDFTNPEALTPSVERATVAEGSTQGVGVDVDGYTFTNGNVSITLTKGSASNPAKFWTRTGGDVELRTYKNSTITISVSEGTMSGIVFNGSKISDITPDSGEFGNGVWSGDAQSVTFSATGTLYITSLEVY